MWLRQLAAERSMLAEEKSVVWWYAQLQCLDLYRVLMSQSSLTQDLGAWQELTNQLSLLSCWLTGWESLSLRPCFHCHWCILNIVHCYLVAMSWTWFALSYINLLILLICIRIFVLNSLRCQQILVFYCCVRIYGLSSTSLSKETKRCTEEIKNAQVACLRKSLLNVFEWNGHLLSNPQWITIDLGCIFGVWEHVYNWAWALLVLN